MIYKIPFMDDLCGAVADTFVTMVGLKVDNTDGHRVRVRKLRVASAEATPVNENYNITMERVLDLAATGATPGTPAATIAAASIPKVDGEAKTAPFEGYTGPFTVEPATFETEVIYQFAGNMLAPLAEYWPADDEELIVVRKNQFLAVRIAPQVSTARAFSGELVVEWF